MQPVDFAALVDALDRSPSWAAAGQLLGRRDVDVRRLGQALGLRPAGHRLPAAPPPPSAWEESETRREQRRAAARERWARWKAAPAEIPTSWQAPDLDESVVLSRRLPVAGDAEWEALHGAALPSSGRSAAEWRRFVGEEER